MKRLAHRRGVLLAAAAAAVATGAGAGAGTGTGRPTDLQVTVGFEGGGFVPKGRLSVHLDGPAGQQRGAATTTAESDGGSRTITLVLSLPPGADASSPRQVVARLQRADGWLLARGGAQLDGGGSVAVTLHAVMY